jgi:hypothetical protein
MIMRKSNKQMSFLHVYHHALMTLAGFLGTLWVPGGSGMWFGFGNGFVHSFMYSYYFLTAFKPEMKKSIWWKRNITQIQIVCIINSDHHVIMFHFDVSFQAQFVFLATIFIIGVFTKECEFPKFWLVQLGFQNFFMFFMFSDFYRRTYLGKKQKL